MLFVVLTLFLWALALFHIWDHRCYERDLRGYHAGAAGLDWRRVAVRAGEGIGLKRAFDIATPAARLRYAMPVVAFVIWLFVFKSWIAAGFYAAVVIAKWFATLTVLAVDGKSYAVSLAGRRIFSARLD